MFAQALRVLHLKRPVRVAVALGQRYQSRASPQLRGSLVIEMVCLVRQVNAALRCLQSLHRIVGLLALGGVVAACKGFGLSLGEIPKPDEPEPNK